MSRYLRALHEAGHAIVGKALGHEVYRVHIGDDGDYCDGGYLSSDPNGDPPGRRKRAVIALGGYFATALYGQGQGFDVSDWDVAGGDWAEFDRQRDGRSFRHARRIVMAILRDKRDELLALARLVEAEGDVVIDPHPSEYAEAVL